MKDNPSSNRFLEEFKRWIMRFIMIIAAICLLTGGCSALNRKFNLEDDHPVEELLEKVIEENTQLDIDLSPDSKENGKD